MNHDENPSILHGQNGPFGTPDGNHWVAPPLEAAEARRLASGSWLRERMAWNGPNGEHLWMELKNFYNFGYVMNDTMCGP